MGTLPSKPPLIPVPEGFDSKDALLVFIKMTFLSISKYLISYSPIGSFSSCGISTQKNAPYFCNWIARWEHDNG
ncbi:MAG TPA: hypothetical protein VJ729_14035 [Nitrososphaeraceae archaeon]|nr:hypothetical protein [Nitrososphaeraceae archaeon]